MQRRLMTLLLVVPLAGLALSPVAGAAPGDCRQIRPPVLDAEGNVLVPAVEVCRQDVWFHVDPGAGKLGNMAGAGNGKIPSWNTTKPTGSMQGGAGGSYAAMRLLDIFQPSDAKWRPSFEGTFTGNLDNIAAELYVSLPVYQALGSPYPMLAKLVVDGELLHENAAEIDVPMQRVNDAVARVRFAFTNVYAAMEAAGMTLDGSHTIRLEVLQRYWGDGIVSAIHYDAADVPSGLIFNNETVGAYTPIDLSPAE